LLYESGKLHDDQLEALESDSKRIGTQGGELDFALLLDGLAAEREQGITIDVAYRYFSTERRNFIVADTPGHEQYTRNMVTGASTAEVAVILVDARKGILTQTRRHSYLVSLLGIRHVVLAVNKLDLVDYSQEVFDSIDADYRAFAAELGVQDIVSIPLSALRGDNVTEASPNTPWYSGPTLMQYLEAIEVDDDTDTQPFRFVAQWVNRPNLDFRGYSGVIVGGTVRTGDRIRVVPSGVESTISRIVTYDGDLEEAVAGESVTICLADEVDVSRGDVIAAATEPPLVADQFETHVVWMSEEEMLPGRRYLVKIGGSTLGATVEEPKYLVNINTLEHMAAKTLELNQIGVCNLTLEKAVPFDPYKDNRDMGGFIIIDRMTNNTVGVGLIHFALRRADNVHWQAIEVDATAHATLKGQRPAVVWFTGLSGAGKSTIANIVERKLHAEGRHTYLLDGDNLRHGLNKDLGFTTADRIENVRRTAEVASLMAEAGLIVLVSLISPYRAERRMARDLAGANSFLEIYVDTPLEVAESRDRKGLYAKARRGEIPNFTGIGAPYEEPENPELHISTADYSPEHAADAVIRLL
jgi:bifunctional enzyme CysN/CysC